jgi:hypothetical protein
MNVLPMNKVNPNHLPNPAVPGVSPKELQQRITQTRKLLEGHRAARPSNLDIPKITLWAQEKDVLEGRLELLEAQAKAGWHDVQVPIIAPAQPPPAPAAVASQRTPPPRPVLPSPFASEVAMPRTPKPPQEQLAHLVQSLKDQIQKLETAVDQKAFRRIRQSAYWKRAEVAKFAGKHNLVVPELPVVPGNPWGSKAVEETPEALATPLGDPSKLNSVSIREALQEEVPEPKTASVSGFSLGGRVLQCGDLDLEEILKARLQIKPAPSELSVLEAMSNLHLALRCLQSGFFPDSPLGFKELVGIIADYAQRAVLGVA